MKWQGQGEDRERGREREKRLSVKRSDKKPEIWVLPWKPAVFAKVAQTESGQTANGLFAAALTYIDLTENNVYYAANHNQGVEHIPGIPKIALSEWGAASEASWMSDQNKKNKSLYSYTKMYTLQMHSGYLNLQKPL